MDDRWINTMSLDVSLTNPALPLDTLAMRFCSEGTRHGHYVFSFDQLEKFVAALPLTKDDEVYSANITHNLTEMADAAGIYKACWHPDEIGVTRARQLIPLLEAGLAKLVADPKHYSKFDAPNGWGTYEHFVPWVARYLEACRAHPEAEVRVSR